MANIADLLLPLLRISTHRTLRRAWRSSAGQGSKRVAIVAHFDPDGRIAPWLASYLAELKALGFRVILASTSPTLDQPDVDRALKTCSDVIWRKNVGLDFYSWKLALERLDVPLADLEGLLLANDSVYGPFTPLTEVFRRVTASPATVVGLTDSREIAPHLQSYFVYYKPEALRAPWFRAFWKGLELLEDKSEIIRRYEVGLGQVLAREGVRHEALYPYDDVAAAFVRAGGTLPPEPQNPTLRMWRTLLEDFAFPFVKGELVRKNPLRLPGVDQWPELVPRGREAQLAEVRDYVARLKGR